MFQRDASLLAALDDIHNVRSRLVFLNEMKQSPDSIKEAFDQGNFTVKKTSRVFLAMVIDLAHEQNNREVKVDDGTVDTMDNEIALLELVLSGSYAAKMVCESRNAYPSNHHEDTKSFEKEVHSRRIKLIEAFKDFENPFSDPPEELKNIVSNELISAKASSFIRSAFQIGQSQCNVFTKEKLNAVNTNSTSLYTTISKNNLTIFKCKAAVIVSKKKKQATALKECDQL